MLSRRGLHRLRITRKKINKKLELTNQVQTPESPARRPAPAGGPVSRSRPNRETARGELERESGIWASDQVFKIGKKKLDAARTGASGPVYASQIPDRPTGTVDIYAQHASRPENPVKAPALRVDVTVGSAFFWEAGGGGGGHVLL